MKRRTKRQIADAIGLGVALAVAASIAVGARGAEEATAPDAAAIYNIELTSYEKALVAWRRDSAVIDSVSRTIDTDTLYRLYRQLLVAPDPAVAMQEVACEEWRFARRYQPLPTAAAVKRMRDSLWRPADASAIRQLEARLPEVGHVQVGHWECGYPGEQRVPAEVDGASMAVAVARPTPPRPPRR